MSKIKVDFKKKLSVSLGSDDYNNVLVPIETLESMLFLLRNNNCDHLYIQTEIWYEDRDLESIDFYGIGSRTETDVEYELRLKEEEITRKKLLKMVLDNKKQQLKKDKTEYERLKAIFEPKD